LERFFWSHDGRRFGHIPYVVGVLLQKISPGGNILGFRSDLFFRFGIRTVAEGAGTIFAID